MEQNTSINGSTGVNDHNEWMHQEMEFFRKLDFVKPLFVWIISIIEIPVMILTLVALCALIKSQRSASVFVIHLILSDLIQIICMLMMTIEWPEDLDGAINLLYKWKSAYFYSLMAGVYFMACVAFERYLLVSHPIWYKSHHSLKVSCVVSVIIWFVPLIFAHKNSYSLFKPLPRSIGCFIPYPIIILCFVGTRRGLSHAISLTSLKRQLILGSLFLVLLTYTFLILPFIILIFVRAISPSNHSLLLVKFIQFFKHLLYLSPLADCILYLFMRPDAGDLMKFDRCCCRTDTHQNSTHSRGEHSRDSRATFSGCVSVQNPASRSQTACSSV
ncbi:hypothetical protein ABG768_012444 [Culter alburnus]|uniref:G-protein coupled receptors family 1 profile domain-containing protein n=1 Tax=Culter alburnus TaxID=194366 RepID=A0AAW2B1T1_CULAL